MEKPGIEPATPGLQGIALIHYTTGASHIDTFVDRCVELVSVWTFVSCRLHISFMTVFKKVKSKGFSFFFAISFYLSDFMYLLRTQFIFHNVKW